MADDNAVRTGNISINSTASARRRVTGPNRAPEAIEPVMGTAAMGGASTMAPATTS